MTNLICPDLEPVVRLRSAIPESCQAMLDQLLGMVPQPPDQPSCATAIATLTKCLVDYAETIANTRPFFMEWAGAAQCIHDRASAYTQHIQGTTPSAPLTGRLSEFPALALLLTLKDEHLPLQVALGAEIARCLLEQTQLKQDYCVALRRDTVKYGRPQPGEVRTPEDLAELGFGRGWLVRFQKIDAQVRRRVELDELGPRRPQHARPHHVLDLLARLRWRLDYPNPKHRQAAIDDSHLPVAHYLRVATLLRTRVEARDGAAVIQSLGLLVNLPPRLLLSLPLVTGSRPLNMLGISVQTGCLQLNLRALFPNRARPPDATANLFHFSGDAVVVPLPVFLVQEIQRRSQAYPQAVLLGDLMDWVQVNPRDSLIPGESCKLHASLARASKSTGAISLALGNDRLVSACVATDFSLIGSARMYYARLTGREIHTGCTRLFAGIGWGVPVMDAVHLPSLGSRATLHPDGAKHLFSALAEAVTASRPGRNAHSGRLLEHHTHFTRYCVALICFCAGLREIQCYRLLAEELLHGQDQIVVHDKQGGDALMAQPALLNAQAREQIRLYAAHARALVRRLQRLNDRQGLVLAQRLRIALEDAGSLFLTLRSSGTVLAAGAHFTWREVPESIRVPPNVGRHFWQNVLRERGLSSRDIDSFMRHRVVGLERNTNSQVGIPRQTLDRIEATQLAVMREIGIQTLAGLCRE
ncbi:hypothetical protein HF896_19875 [Alicycliphilus denitrificans]|uniref:Uncharacterized protein n=1 Tax=Alicycliphilus denitrificans TaxID=179636 RepID=A0A858ZXR1_9BURK|nr:hypothetical protein [Alicycliphilus denitrificans]QKD45735.1 hypothetical protein HF896_19875 [Alicycliphilus denitrificans]